MLQVASEKKQKWLEEELVVFLICPFFHLKGCDFVANNRTVCVF